MQTSHSRRIFLQFSATDPVADGCVQALVDVSRSMFCHFSEHRSYVLLHVHLCRPLLLSDAGHGQCLRDGHQATLVKPPSWGDGGLRRTVSRTNEKEGTDLRLIFMFIMSRHKNREDSSEVTPSCKMCTHIIDK